MRREERLEEAGGLLDRGPPRRRAQPRVLVIPVRTVRRAVTQILVRRYEYVDADMIVADVLICDGNDVSRRRSIIMRDGLLVIAKNGLYLRRQDSKLVMYLDGDAPLLGGAAEGLEGGAVEGAGRGQADGGEEERCSEHGDTRPERWQLAARSRVPSGFSDSDMLLAMFGHVRNG